MQGADQGGSARRRPPATERVPVRTASLLVALYAFVGTVIVTLQPVVGPSPWYPPVAVGVALVVLAGYRWLAAVLVLEVVLSSVQYRTDPAGGLLVAAAMTIETALAAMIVRRFRVRVERTDDVIAIGLAALAAPMAGATAALAGGALVGRELGTPWTWIHWVGGDATALATILPLLLLVVARGAPALRVADPRALLHATAVAVVAGVLVVATALVGLVTTQAGTMRFLWALPVLWAALRLGRMAAVVTTCVIAAVSFAVMVLAGVPNEVAVLGGQAAVVTLGLAGLGTSVVLHERDLATEDLRRALADLEASERRYATLFGSSPDMQMLVSPETGEIVDVNEAAAEFYGHARGALIGTSAAHYAAPDGTTVMDRLAEARDGVALTMIARHDVAGGRTATVEVRSGIVSIEGRPLIHLVLRDVTAEEAARAEIVRLAAAVESSAEAIVTTDLDGVVTGWNAAATTLYGHAHEEALGRNIDDLLGPVEMRLEAVADAARRGDTLLLGLVSRRSKAGSDIPVELAISPIIDRGEVVGLGHFSHDMRHVLAREAELRRSRATLAEAAAVGAMGSFEWDSDTLEHRWSEELYRIAGVDPTLATADFLALIHPEDRQAFGDALMDVERESDERAVRMVRPDGVVRDTLVRWRTITEASVDPGSPPIVRRIGIVRDVTDERALEVQLRQAQRLESIGLLAGGIAHDFNNLLTAIGGFTELAKMTAAAGESPDEELGQVLGAVDRARSLTQQLLAFGRRAIVRPEPVDVSAAVAALVPILRRLLGERIAVSTELGLGAGTIIDRGALDQVLVNLAVNARDAMPGGGNLRISTGTTPAAGTDSGFLTWIEVEDDGTGMPAHVLEQAFLPFFTTKERGQGTGLGLSTVQGIVAMAGGSVDVTSAPGEGTRFRLTLPGVADAAAEPVPAASPSHWRGSGVVLLVEDEDLVRRVAERVLTAAGWHVVVAANVPDALALADRERPDILVSDIVLPGIADGVTLAETLRARWPSLPVLLTTGYTEHEPPSWTEVLLKPYASEALVDAVRRLLDGARDADLAVDATVEGSLAG